MSRICKTTQSWFAAGLIAAAASIGALGFAGCERKEKVIDIETPGADVEVERNIDTGEVEVETNRD
ncbi:MAG: hypothetical protein L0228_02770 [Planctomycetes bacterium]|nr:hypothetical protein [Planctomycetota bacterium]